MDKMAGLGKYTYPDGSTYYGETDDNKRSGNGIESSKT